MNLIQLKTNVNSVNGKINIPGDKSISHRAIIFGAIAEGKTTVTNFLLGDDCLNTIKCFRHLGVKIIKSNNEVSILGKGFASLKKPSTILDVGNSGTTIRLLLGLLANCPFETTLTGDDSIAQRPMTRVTKPLSLMGAQITGKNDGEYTPLLISGNQLKGITYSLPIASAQVKSALLLAGINAVGVTTIIEKELTRDHTERMITHFGGEISQENKTITIAGGQKLVGQDVFVPGDISSAAFFLVAAAIVPHSKITLKNVGLNETRTGIIDVMKRMGANLTVESTKEAYFERYGDLTIESSNLKGIEIGGEIIPRLIDELPIIALLATQAEGTTIIKDAAELKVKETNRIDTVVTELSKLGANITATEDGMIIKGRTPLKGNETVSSYGDHRIGMMLAIAALLCKQPVKLKQPDCIAISYPQFFTHLEAIT